MDLKCQLDALQMESSSQRGKGNSIFSEVGLTPFTYKVTSILKHFQGWRSG